MYNNSSKSLIYSPHEHRIAYTQLKRPQTAIPRKRDRSSKHYQVKSSLDLFPPAPSKSEKLFVKRKIQKEPICIPIKIHDELCSLVNSTPRTSFNMNSTERKYYDNFVKLLSKYEPKEMEIIARDAIKAATEKKLLANYTGTEIGSSKKNTSIDNYCWLDS